MALGVLLDELQDVLHEAGIEAHLVLDLLLLALPDGGVDLSFPGARLRFAWRTWTEALAIWTKDWITVLATCRAPLRLSKARPAARKATLSCTWSAAQTLPTILAISVGGLAKRCIFASISSLRPSMFFCRVFS